MGELVLVVQVGPRTVDQKKIAPTSPRRIMARIGLCECSSCEGAFPKTVNGTYICVEHLQLLCAEFTTSSDCNLDDIHVYFAMASSTNYCVQVDHVSSMLKTRHQNRHHNRHHHRYHARAAARDMTERKGTE
jgi:hypothetical protein